LIDKGIRSVAALEAARPESYAEAAKKTRSSRGSRQAARCIQSDDYAAAQRITALLIEHNVPTSIFTDSPRSRRSMNDTTRPKKNFKLAKDLGSLSTYGKEPSRT